VTYSPSDSDEEDEVSGLEIIFRNSLAKLRLSKRIMRKLDAVHGIENLHRETGTIDA
jgi:hypothetical protein